MKYFTLVDNIKMKLEELVMGVVEDSRRINEWTGEDTAKLKKFLEDNPAIGKNDNRGKAGRVKLWQKAVECFSNKYPGKNFNRQIF